MKPSENARAAVLNAMIGRAIIEALGMIAENQRATVMRIPPPFSQSDVAALIDRHHIDGNAVVKFMEGST